MSKFSAVFPGQGTQQIGMGQDLWQQFSSARRVFELADARLDFLISNIILEGPSEELNKTINTQPAVVIVSLAVLEALRETNKLPEFNVVAGHSLGEYTALAAADVLSIEDTVFLARERGRLMHEASLRQPGGMVAVIGLDTDIISNICHQTDTFMANINCPGQVVISGSKMKIQKAAEIANKAGAKRVIPLEVSGAFHSPLMGSAVEGLAEVINSLDFNNPKIPIVANTTAEIMTTAEEVVEELLRQLCTGVLWQSSIELMRNNGINSYIEIGPGQVLTGLIRRIYRDVRVVSVSNALEVSSFSC